jgi:hypothetical protein
MKQQFTYSLDEAKIRKELMDLKPGNAEDAWQKFSQYADTQPRQVAVRKMPVIKLAVDRRILVPVAAAIVIIVLAALVFNFMDLKKSSKTNNQKAVVAEPFVPMPQISEAETILPPPEKQDPMETQWSENSKALAASKPEVVKEKSEKPLPSPNDGAMASAVKPKPTETAGSADAQTTQAEVKKKKAQNKELVPLQVPDLRPNLLTDEQVDDIRPN